MSSVIGYEFKVKTSRDGPGLEIRLGALLPVNH